MHISGCGYDFRQDPHFTIKRPNGVGEYILLIIRSPAYVILQDTVHYTKGNAVVVYRKGSGQYYGAHNTEFVNDWVRFELSEEDLAFLDSIGIAFDTILEYPDVYPLSRLVKLLFIERWSNNLHAEDSQNLLLRLLFLKLSDYNDKKPVIYSPLTEKLTKLRNDIYANPQNNWTIDNICAALSLSPSYLQHKYKEIFGNSIKNDITASRLEYAKYLLSSTDHTVSDISQMVGYENDVHFMYIFKKKNGFTPSQYRSSASLRRK